MVGYFSSKSFVQLAPGLASFLRRSNRTMRLIISPFITHEDRRAIENGLKSDFAFLENSVASLLLSEDGIVRHTFRCLSYLIAHKRLDIKIALMRNAQFHVKAWVVTQGEERLAAHGSGNLTEAGLVKNLEQIIVSRSWVDTNQDYLVNSFISKFNALWERSDQSCRIYDLPEALENQILKEYPVDRPPREEEYLDLVR